MHVQKAYLNATGKIATYMLTPDVKRAMADSKAPSGLINIISSQATSSVILMENDDSIKKELLAFAERQFGDAPDKSVSRRSGTGADKFHLMAALTGLSVTLSFHQGRLLTHAQHEVIVLDYEPKPGRREFVISVLPAGGAAGGQPQPGGMR